MNLAKYPLLFSMLLSPAVLWAEGEQEVPAPVAEPTAAVEAEAGATAVLGSNSSAVKISADKVEFDRATGSSVYSGNVSLTQGRLSLVANSLEVFTANKRLSRIKARGRPATFSSRLEDGRPVIGEASVVEFDARGEVLTLIGEGKLLQGENSIENDRIVYNLKTDNLRAGGEGSSGRVEVILLPAE